MQKAVEPLLRSHISQSKYIKGLDSALQMKAVIDALYQGDKKTKLEDALATAFKPFVKEGLVFNWRDSFEVRLKKALELKGKVESLEGTCDSTALRTEVLDCFKISVEAEIGSAQSLEDMLAIKDKVKQIEDGLSTTALQDFIAQKFEDRLLRAIRALENRDLSEAKKGMLELKAAVPEIQNGCSEAAAKKLQDVWNEGTTSLKLSRRPVHDQTWGEKPFDKVSTLFNRSATELTGFRDEENWNDPKFQGNPVRAAVMSILWYERKTERMLLAEDLHEWDRYVSEVSKMATKAGKTDFAETYPNRSSKILAIVALLNPPSDDGETRSFVLKRSTEILSTGGPWGFNYKKKENTPKEELCALYGTAWNTGIRQSDTENPLQDLAKNLIKSASTKPDGYDEQRLINHQAIAFTIAAKAVATVKKDITDDQIMGALNGQLAKVWSGKTITKQALAKKLEALEERMQ